MTQDTCTILCLVLQDCTTEGNVLRSHVQKPYKHCFVQGDVRGRIQFLLVALPAFTALWIAFFALEIVERELTGIPNWAATSFFLLPSETASKIVTLFLFFLKRQSL